MVFGVRLDRTVQLRTADVPTDDLRSGEARSTNASSLALLEAPRSRAPWVERLGDLGTRILDGFHRQKPAVCAAILGATLLPGLVPGAPLSRPAHAEPVPVVVQARTEPRAIASHGFRARTDHGVRGAYFRKVESRASTEYGGIQAVGWLPTPAFDGARAFVSPDGIDHFQTGPLDRPSVYMGGRAAGHELDVGLTWDRLYDGAGRAAYTDLARGFDGGDPAHRFFRTKVNGALAIQNGSGQVVAEGNDARAMLSTLTPSFAFRPYWRTTNDGSNQWNQPAKNAADNLYFQPGEAIVMRVRAVDRDRVRLHIGRTDGGPAFTVAFRQEGFGRGGAQSFKRVNAMDQFGVENGARKGREARDVLPTLTEVLGGGWASVHLLDRQGAPLEPMTGPKFTEVRGGDTAPRYDAIFTRAELNDAGGERIDIHPSR